MCDSHANDWEFNPLPLWSCLCKDELLLNHSFRLTIAWPMLAAMMVPRESLRRKVSAIVTKKEHSCSLNEQSGMWGIKKKDSWEQATVNADWKPNAAPLRLRRNTFLYLFIYYYYGIKDAIQPYMSYVWFPRNIYGGHPGFTWIKILLWI